MALIRNILLITFEENDTASEKDFIRRMFTGKGYNMIAETKIDKTGIVKEWIMESPVTYGKLQSNPEPEKKVFQFNPKGE